MGISTMQKVPDSICSSWCSYHLTIHGYKCFIEKDYHPISRSSRFRADIWTDPAIEQVMMKSIKSHEGLTSGRGLIETVHLQWLYSMHKCVAIHGSMTTLTGWNYQTSDKHIGLGTSKSNCDFCNLKSIQQCIRFGQREPFDLTEHRLRSLPSGLMATDNDCISCDKVEIRARLQKQLDNLSISEASIKRKDHMYSL